MSEARGPGALRGRHPLRHLLLDGEDGASDVPVLVQHLEEDGRGQLVGQIAHHRHRPGPGQLGEAHLGGVGSDDPEPLAPSRGERLDEVAVALHRHHPGSTVEQRAGEVAQARPSSTAVSPGESEPRRRWPPPPPRRRGSSAPSCASVEGRADWRMRRGESTGVDLTQGARPRPPPGRTRRARRAARPRSRPRRSSRHCRCRAPGEAGGPRCPARRHAPG